jgi:ribonuclease G
MAEEILLSVRDGLVRVAHIVGGQLADVQISPADTKSDDASNFVGRIYLAQVERVVPRLQAAFVNIGEDRAGFLGAREARVLLPDAPRDAAIEDCVSEGDTILVQVTRPPVNDKGAQVTADVTLPGRALVIAPCRSHIALSRAIEDPEARKRLEQDIVDIQAGKHGEVEAVEGMDGPAGWVVRTAAADMDVSELKSDMESIGRRWNLLLDKAQNQEPPSLLYSDLGPIERALRDSVRGDTNKIVIEGDAAFTVASSYCREAMPRALDAIAKSDKNEFLFDRYDIESKIEVALSPRVELPSGGWLMIETTEAMTTVDVNSGSQNGTALDVNLEAAAIIGQQIQLRGIGGLVAIDFIDMSETSANDQVAEALSGGFEQDRYPVRIGTMSDFGVIEMTRRRPAISLREAMGR